MTTTKQIAKTLLTFFVLVGFSGCAESVQYISTPCKVPKPERKAPTYSCSAKYTDVFEYAKCVSEKATLLEGDYEVLEKAFDSCVK